MSVAPSLTVSLDGNTSIGTVYAIMYNADGTLCAVKEYKASQTVEVKFDANAKGAYVKILWWHGNMYPMCAPQKISL